MDDVKIRRAAYGRLETSLKNNGKTDLLDAFHRDTASGAPQRYDKARQWLEAWLIDPSFALCSLVAETSLVQEEEETTKSKKLTWFKLVREEGEEEAKKLVDEGKVRETKDNYGRSAYEYVDEENIFRNKRQRKISNTQQMQLSADQAAAVQKTMIATSIPGGASFGGARGRARAGALAMKVILDKKTEKEREAVKAVRVARGKVDGKIIELQRLHSDISKSNAMLAKPGAKDIVRQLQVEVAKLKGNQGILEKAQSGTKNPQDLLKKAAEAHNIIKKCGQAVTMATALKKQ
jgi:hypothetical protein